MSLAGGVANLIGIWYQSLGAAAALVDSDWKDKAPEPDFHGDSIRKVGSGQPRREILTEYFDMDLWIRNQHGVELIQFKASSQQELPKFTPSEVRGIFRNATQAILQYERKNAESDTEPIVGFVVASNRPSGSHFDDFQNAVKDHQKAMKGKGVEVNSPEALDEFGKLLAPPNLSSKSVKTMCDLAKNYTREKFKELEFNPEERIRACLKAMANFAFATAQIISLKTSLKQWLSTWGILQSEYATFADLILGKLLSHSVSGRPCDERSIMSSALDSLDAVPLTPDWAWPAVIDDLCNRRWQDTPTRTLITQKGPADWLLDRSELLRGLPFPYGEDTAESDPEERYYKNLSVQPRIFALIGPGGVGKTSLMFQLFAQIAGCVWDWDAKSFRPNEKFRGYPIILPPSKNILEGISGALRNWGHRNVYVDKPIDRFVVASGCTARDSAVWVGLDGLDERAYDNLSELANDLAIWAYSHPNVRLVLTCRPKQFRPMISGLSDHGLMRQLPVNEFSQDEAWKAVERATDQLFQTSSTRFLTVGQRMNAIDDSYTAEPEGFEDSIRQPLFIGVIRRVYKKMGVEVIQKASRHDPDALKIIATKYVHIFCERTLKRLKCVDVDERGIFRALKQLATNVSNPQKAKFGHWESVCESQLDGPITGKKLYTQCAASGLIRDLGSGAFEWRHPFIGTYLPDMEEPVWQ